MKFHRSRQPSESRAWLPYLTVSDGAGAIAFYKKAFGAEERELHLAPGTTKIVQVARV